MTPNNDKRLFLLDAMALIYRSFFALNAVKPMINSKGMNTSAAFGFTNTLIELINKEKPTHIAIAFDTHAPTARHTEFVEYKANREKMPEDLASNIPYIKEIIQAFNIPILEVDGYEADDIIGTMAKKAEQSGYDVYMVTPDKDYGQLVSEHIFMYKPSYQGKPVEIYGVPEVLDKWEIKRVDQVIDMLGMQGDAVDNIPGIPGVGVKTAQKLLAEFDSLENLLENTHQLKGKLKEKVEHNKQQAIISKKLATIWLDVPVDFNETDLTVDEYNKDRLSELFSDLEFRGLGKKLIGEDYSVTNNNGQTSLFDNSGEEVKVEGKNIENTDHNYQLIDTANERAKLIDDLCKQSSFCFDTETTGLDPNDAELVGIAFSYKAHEGFYVPIPENQEGAKQIIQEFKPVLESTTIEKIGQNIKYDALILKWYGIEIQGPLFDTMLAHYIIEPDMRHKMDILAENYLNYKPISIEELIGKKGKNQGNMRDVPLEEVKEYAAEDADITFQLKNALLPELKEREGENIFNEIENPLIPVLTAMEFEGVNVNVSFLEEYSKELEIDIQNTEKNIYEISGQSFNIASPKQLGEILFEKMGIEYKGKKTKTGQYSTSEENLQKLAGEHDIIDTILEFRQLSKLKSTYVDALPKQVNPKTKHIHTTYAQAVAATGRLSSDNPNLQNIPIRSDKGKKVREAFIPRNQDHVLLSADYSQIELRLASHMSGDEGMLNAFKEGQDIHASTAAKVYRVPLQEVTSEMRRKAKTVNFGILYGISAFGLSERIGISRTEAKELIDQYFESFPGIKKYMDESIAFAREHGYVKTIMGRRRYLRDINSKNYTVRGFAERNAINAPLQGSSADMIKIAMINIHSEFNKRKFRSKMILQVHDELIFDTHKEELDEITSIVKGLMQNAITLNVPIVVDTGVGNNWLEAH